MLKKLVSGITLAVCLVALLAGFQMLTPEPATAFGYCETSTMCGFDRGSLSGTCVDEDTGECFQVYTNSNWEQCLEPCSF